MCCVTAKDDRSTPTASESICARMTSNMSNDVSKLLRQTFGAISNDTKSIHARLLALEESVEEILKAPAKRDVETQTIEGSFPVVEELKQKVDMITKTLFGDGTTRRQDVTKARDTHSRTGAVSHSSGSAAPQDRRQQVAPAMQKPMPAPRGSDVVSSHLRVEVDGAMPPAPPPPSPPISRLNQPGRIRIDLPRVQDGTNEQDSAIAHGTMAFLSRPGEYDAPLREPLVADAALLDRVNQHDAVHDSVSAWQSKVSHELHTELQGMRGAIEKLAHEMDTIIARKAGVDEVNAWSKLVSHSLDTAFESIGIETQEAREHMDAVLAQNQMQSESTLSHLSASKVDRDELEEIRSLMSQAAAMPEITGKVAEVMEQKADRAELRRLSEAVIFASAGPRTGPVSAAILHDRTTPVIRSSAMDGVAQFRTAETAEWRAATLLQAARAGRSSPRRKDARPSPPAKARPIFEDVTSNLASSQKTGTVWRPSSASTKLQRSASSVATTWLPKDHSATALSAKSKSSAALALGGTPISRGDSLILTQQLGRDGVLYH